MKIPTPGSPKRADKRGALDTPESIGARLEEVERKMERLRALYESFFTGVDRRAPQVPRTELNRLVLELQQLNIRNAALRFRFQTLSQRWTLLTTYWNRTLREIETGTYRRDLERAFRRLAKRGAPMTADEAVHLGIPANRVQAFVAQQNRRFEASPPTAPGEHRDNGSSDGGTTQPLAPQIQPNVGRPSVVIDSPGIAAVDWARVHRDYVAEHVRLGLTGTPPNVERIQALVERNWSQAAISDPNARLEVSVIPKDGRIVLNARLRSQRSKP